MTVFYWKNYKNKGNLILMKKCLIFMILSVKRELFFKKLPIRWAEGVNNTDFKFLTHLEGKVGGGGENGKGNI